MPDRPRAPADGIRLCPSPPHRAVLGLVRAALGSTSGARLTDPQRQALVADLADSAPDALVQIAFDAYVHVVVATAFDREPALAAAVPEDLVIFFRELQAANLRRNAATRAQLAEIGAAFSAAGLRGTVLKGGAELLDPRFPDPAFRFLSDVDILLQEADIDRAVACLSQTGAQAGDDDPGLYLAHAHAPPLSRPDWPGPVELHRAVGLSAADSRILPAGLIMASAAPSPVPGLDVPRPAHRLAHLVLHAQVHSWRHRETVLSLRDVLELEILKHALPPDEITAATARFAAPEDRAVWDNLDAARGLIFGTTDAARAPPAALRWAETALDLYGRPKRQQLRGLAWTARRYVSELLFDPRRRRHHLAQLVNPRRLGRTIAHQWRRFRHTR